MISDYTIQLFCFTDKEFFWELRDPQGHPICRSEPRNGQRHYTTELSCTKSAVRFRNKILKVEQGCFIKAPRITPRKSKK